MILEGEAMEGFFYLFTFHLWSKRDEQEPISGQRRRFGAFKEFDDQGDSWRAIRVWEDGEEPDLFFFLSLFFSFSIFGHDLDCRCPYSSSSHEWLSFCFLGLY